MFTTPIFRNQRVRFRKVHGDACQGTIGFIREINSQLTIGFKFRETDACERIIYLGLQVALQVLEFELNLEGGEVSGLV